MNRSRVKTKDVVMEIIVDTVLIFMLVVSSVIMPDGAARKTPVSATLPVYSSIMPAEEVNTPASEDVELLALLAMAEAEGESEKGKRLVIDTVLNRVDSPYFPNTISEVIYQPNQFTSMWNGRIERCEVRDDICQLVIEEMECRTNNDIVFFNAGKYSIYGDPLFKEGNHYFSGY